MKEAVALLEKDVLSGVIEHDGDRVVSLHIDAVDVQRRPDGSKHVGKRSEGVPVDAFFALALADYIETTELPKASAEPWAATW